MPRSTNPSLTLILIALLGISITACPASRDKEPEPKTQEASKELTYSQKQELKKTIEEKAHLQPRRKQMIDDMINGDIIVTIEVRDNTPYVYVAEPFLHMTPKDQTALLNLIWYYHLTENPKALTIKIFDFATSKDIGKYDYYGLNLK